MFRVSLGKHPANGTGDVTEPRTLNLSGLDGEQRQGAALFTTKPFGTDKTHSKKHQRTHPSLCLEVEMAAVFLDFVCGCFVLLGLGD